MSGNLRSQLADPAVLVAHFSYDLTAAVMAGIERATIDQGPHATLDVANLRRAIFSGISRHLAAELEKKRERATRTAGDIR